MLSSQPTWSIPDPTINLNTLNLTWSTLRSGSSRSFSGLVWRPYRCALRNSLATNIFLNKNVIFIGDSHIRTLFNFLLREFANVLWTALKGIMEMQCVNLEIPFGRTLAGDNATWCFAWDPFGFAVMAKDWKSLFSANDTSLALIKWDVIITGIASHDMYTFRSLSGFRARLPSFFAGLKALPGAHLLLFWGAPMPPLRNDAWVLPSKDMRTAHRVSAANEIVREEFYLEFSNQSAMFIDSALITSALVDSSTDLAHYLQPFVGKVYGQIVLMALEWLLFAS